MPADHHTQGPPGRSWVDFSRWPTLASWPGKTTAAILLPKQTNSMFPQSIPMVLLPERLLKGPLVAKQKTTDPSKRQMGESLSLSYLLSTKFDFPGVLLSGSPGTAKGSYEIGTFVDKCPIPHKRPAFLGDHHCGEGKTNGELHPSKRT